MLAELDEQKKRQADIEEEHARIEGLVEELTSSKNKLAGEDQVQAKALEDELRKAIEYNKATKDKLASIQYEIDSKSNEVNTKTWESKRLAERISEAAKDQCEPAGTDDSLPEILGEFGKQVNSEGNENEGNTSVDDYHTKMEEMTMKLKATEEELLKMHVPQINQHYREIEHNAEIEKLQAKAKEKEEEKQLAIKRSQMAIEEKEKVEKELKELEEELERCKAEAQEKEKMLEELMQTEYAESEQNDKEEPGLCTFLRCTTTAVVSFLIANPILQVTSIFLITGFTLFKKYYPSSSAQHQPYQINWIIQISYWYCFTLYSSLS
eukprot:TRINITY_DN928_c9_g1_i6.p4 TRINITY_DN928_c9_g1~~TRINITY_DN928_c9_g1_i6.p4  ORF type:complete len:324 (+),score=59.86 TRINITY_DN928_c9_g1_i6:858-1829(+)